MDYSGSEEYADFIEHNDLGFPAAVLVVNGAVTLTDAGRSFIEQTWQSFCEVVEVDHYGEYSSLEDVMTFE